MVTNNPNKKIVLYMAGGAMSGCYGAGVLKGLHDLSLVDNIESIYSGSVGCINTAYLLSGQIELGPTIYWENLKSGFISRFNVIRGTLDLVENRFVRKMKNQEVHSVLDIDYVCNILSKVKPLDLEIIKSNPINFYIKISDVDAGETEYKLFKDCPTLDILKASITAKPYYFDETIIEGKRYIDGTVTDPIGIKYLIDKHPEQKIIVVLNEPIHRGLRHYAKHFIEAVVASLYPYRISLFRAFISRENKIREDIQICLNNENVLLLYPDFKHRVRPRTINPSVLKNNFRHGIEDSRKALSFINNDFVN